MSSHANCTHEKTKAARAACRAGRQTPAEGATTSTARDRLRDKAAAASSKLSEPRAEGSSAASVISGFCGGHHHDRCPGGGKQWHCDCDCHTAHAE